jgi:hypothetical protein
MPSPLPIAPLRRWRRKRHQLPALLVCLLLACGLAVSVCACSLPVFRFALDRWPADTFRLLVTEDDAADPGVAKFLRNFGADSGLNLEIQRTSQGPSRILRPAQADSEEITLWQGRVTEPWLRNLGASPAGTEIVRLLLAGDSAVWVLLESGEPHLDDPAAALLEKRLAYLQQAIQIPPADPNDLSSRPGPGPELTVRFSLVRLRAATGAGEDPESLLRANLAGPQSPLPTPGKPWFAAVFGRGRVLGVWPAEDFGNEQTDEICIFLSGACSCQVKRQNPGWDLLLNVDWEGRLRAIGGPSGTSTPKTAAVQNHSETQLPAVPAPETVRFDPASTSTNVDPAKAPPQWSAPPRIVALPLAVLGLLLLTIANRHRLKKALKK